MRPPRPERINATGVVERQCSKCQRWKTQDDFRPLGGKQSGQRSARCRLCLGNEDNRRRRERRAGNDRQAAAFRAMLADRRRQPMPSGLVLVAVVPAVKEIEWVPKKLIREK